MEYLHISLEIQYGHGGRKLEIIEAEEIYEVAPFIPQSHRDTKTFLFKVTAAYFSNVHDIENLV